MVGHQDEAPPPAPASQGGRRRRRSPTHIDWKRGAQMLVEGQTPAAVGRVLGIPEERVWRHFETSEHFRALIHQASMRWRLLQFVVRGEAVGGEAMRGEEGEPRPAAEVETRTGEE